MQLGLFSVSYAGLWGQHRLDVEAFIGKAAELGYASVMLMAKRPHISPLDTHESELAGLRAALKRHGISCGAVAGYTDFSRPRAAEVPTIEMQISYVESLASMAAALDARLVRVFTAYEVEHETPTATWNLVVASIRECADRAAAHGITLAVQNHHDVAVHTDALLELLLDIDRPNVKISFDAWSPALRGEDLYDAARRAAPYAAMTTNADYLRLPRFGYRGDLVNYEPLLPDMARAVCFGTGSIDYEAFFRGLVDGGFPTDGLANFEICSPIRGGGCLQNLDDCARGYVDWMRRHVLNAAI
ncbi:MAG TPA: sugar phosphate isomerase/epimerase family protein [Pirellulales bacterium]|nr:sugar phosphate isomerase/epimerase family protein [Pirellulales bacterium]